MAFFKKQIKTLIRENLVTQRYILMRKDFKVISISINYSIKFVFNLNNLLMKTNTFWVLYVKFT